MNRISTASSWQSALLNLMTAQQTQNDAQIQVSTGKLASDLQGYGQTSETITAMQGAQTRLQSFITANQGVSQRLAVQDTGFGEVSDAGDGLRQSLTNALALGSATGLMQSLKQYYQQAVDGLNAQNNGVYVFGGGRTDVPPVNAPTLADLAAAPSVASVFQNGSLKSSSQIDNSTSVQTGFLASDVGTDLFTVMQAIAQYDAGPSGPLQGQLTAAQTTFLQSQLAPLIASNTEVTNYQAENGALQQNLTSHITAQQTQSDSLTSLLGSKTDADMASAISKLTQAQQSVEASAQVLASLKSYSLLNFLSPGG
jgi:flagellar hook-associated protein 3 FlgL